MNTLDEAAAGLPMVRERIDGAGLQRVMWNGFGFRWNQHLAGAAEIHRISGSGAASSPAQRHDPRPGSRCVAFVKRLLRRRVAVHDARLVRDTAPCRRANASGSSSRSALPIATDHVHTGANREALAVEFDITALRTVLLDRTPGVPSW